MTGGTSVLIIDDDPVNRMLMSKFMQREGCQTQEVADGATACRLILEKPFDMILLDIEMPEMNGFDVLQRIKSNKDTATIPVVMVSGLEDTQSVIKAIELGADDYVTKPVSRTLLRARTNAILERKRLHDIEQNRVRSIFSRFVPEEVADELLRGGETSIAGKEIFATVLFSDIRSFTPWAEQNSPEAVIRVLNEYLSSMTDVILDHGGTLVCYMGDGIMALFGAPVENESHADLALAAARAMTHEAVPEFNSWMISEGFEQGFTVGIGLHSGPVMSGTVGTERRLEYTAVGDTVNTASRLEQMTKETEAAIALSGETRSRLRSVVGLHGIGEIQLRGKSHPIDVWAADASGA